MNSELLLLIRKHTDTSIEQTKTKPQETLEYKRNKQLETFFLFTTNELCQRGKMVISSTRFWGNQFCF